jgi:type IV secretory pathway VirB2 component (pilin)
VDYWASLVAVAGVAVLGIAVLFGLRNRPAHRQWAWLVLLVTAGAIGFGVLLLAGPVAFALFGILGD